MNASSRARTSRTMAICSVWVLLLCCAAAPGWAQGTTQSTGEVPLDGSKGRKDKPPKFKLPKGVTVNKTLTIDKKTGEATQKCVFKNGSDQGVDFIFCDMMALNSAFKNAESTNTCNLSYDKTKKVWSCVAGKNEKNSHVPPSFHFGCTEVRLTQGESKTVETKTADNTDHPRPDNFKNKEAKQFQVSYADVFDLSGGATFDSESCKKLKCFGGNTDTNLESADIRDKGTGFWIVQKLPVTDPYVWWQELSGTIHLKEYAPMTEGLSVPSQFPFSCPDLGRTSPDTEPPLYLTQDMNLWDIYTMSSPPDVVQPVSITPYYPNHPDDAGVNLAISSSAPQVAGESMDFGTFAILRPPTTVPEGTTVDGSIAFSDPSDPSAELWEEDVNIVQDTMPPQILSHAESFDETGQVLHVSVKTSDATTSPVGGNFWYSSDGGQTCTPVPMMPLTKNNGDLLPGAFGAAVNLGPNHRPIQFFYNVQDEVFNNVWFGVGTIN